MSVDWNLRESARARIRITVRRLLKKYGTYKTYKNGNGESCGASRIDGGEYNLIKK